MQTIFSTEAGLSRLFDRYGDRILRLTQFVRPSEMAIHYRAQPVFITPLTDLNFELLLVDGPVRETQVEGVTLRLAGDLAYFQLTAEENDKGLASLSQSLYGQLFKILSSMEGYQLVRIWNYIPRILELEQGIERYRLFNAGRFNAWPAGVKIPAATGIGAHGGLLTIEVLLTRRNVRAVQNYCQIPPVDYSITFGDRPPVFSRASLLQDAQGAQLIVAGTASVVGEATMHATVEAQVRETMDNLQALLSRRNLGTCEFRLKELHSLRVYVKHPADLAVIQQEVERYFSPEQVIYLEDDICRRGLLLEVEGIAG